MPIVAEFLRKTAYVLCMMKLALIGVLLLMTTAPALAFEVQGRASVIDGDSLEIRGVEIRLEDIDAPEAGQTCTRNSQRWRCGQAAAMALADRTGTLPVTCSGNIIDRYGRLLAICYAGREDLNGWLVRQGWAVAYRRFASYARQSEDLEMEKMAARIRARAMRRAGEFAKQMMQPHGGDRKSNQVTTDRNLMPREKVR